MAGVVIGVSVIAAIAVTLRADAPGLSLADQAYWLAWGTWPFCWASSSIVRR